MPGALLPEDLPRIAESLGYESVESFAESCLLASEGAVVGLPDGSRVELATLVPAHGEDGSCVFLKDDRCVIHTTAPFGCSHFDAHMSDDEAAARSHALCVALMHDRHENGVYTRLTRSLGESGRRAPPLTQRRAAVQREIAGG